LRAFRRSLASKADSLGGLYGVASVAFWRIDVPPRNDASKIALVALVEHLRAKKFALLDTQWLTPHLQQLAVSKFRGSITCASA